jgi:hypothetical protein
MKSVLEKLGSILRITNEEQKELEVVAVPGLTTLLDVALYRTVEGQLTATVTSAHSLLAAWFDLKRQAIRVLQCLHHDDIRSLEQFARICVDSACGAITRLTTDRFAESANLSDGACALPTIHQHGTLLAAIEESSFDTKRRSSMNLYGKDCWESNTLFCPDYVWGDDAALHCQRFLRQLLKHPFFVERAERTSGLAIDPNRQVLNAEAEREASVLLLVLQADIPARLVQFRTSIEADAAVIKRLYLVKCEYRAPFRAFLESHQSLQKAPSLGLVDEFLNLPTNKVEQRRQSAKDRLQELLDSPELKEALALEQKCEEFEVEMAKAIYSFGELARFLENKRANLKPVEDILEPDDLDSLHETLRRLKGVLCRKNGYDTSIGIRPILLDLQGVPRDDDICSTYFTTEKDDTHRLEIFVDHLQILRKLCQVRNAFLVERNFDMPSSIKQGCKEFDHELFCCRFLDWLDMVKRQHALTNTANFEKLVERIRRAEMQTSLAAATNQTLEVVRKRLEVVASDREKRFRVMSEMIEEICLREMNLRLKLLEPEKNKALELQPTTSLGIFGLALQMAGHNP